MWLLILVDALSPSQTYFSHVGTFPQLKQFQAEFKVSW